MPFRFSTTDGSCGAAFEYRRDGRRWPAAEEEVPIRSAVEAAPAAAAAAADGATAAAEDWSASCGQVWRHARSEEADGAAHGSQGELGFC